jgi:hypothetical protein
MKRLRLPNNPIITPDLDERIGENINGPSLIRVPDWVEGALGRYYLYFAAHGGKFIRLAYADKREGPWRIYAPGVLNLEDSCFTGHIASPDVHVIDASREIRMYYHGWHGREDPPFQRTRVAISRDGLHFRARPETLGASYWRAFQWNGFWYALEMPGRFRRSVDGLSQIEEGPRLFTPSMRHAAVRVRGHVLDVFYSNAGDCPERILWSTIDLRPDWREWRASAPVTILEPEKEYEGADCPLEPSKRGAAPGRVRQLRDPCVFEEDGKTHLLYAIAGESGIAIAQLFTEPVWTAS